MKSICYYIFALELLLLPLMSHALPVMEYVELNKKPENNSSLSTLRVQQNVQVFKENLKNLSRVHVEEKASLSEQIDQVMEALNLEKKECTNVTWGSLFMQSLFGKKNLCT